MGRKTTRFRSPSSSPERDFRVSMRGQEPQAIGSSFGLKNKTGDELYQSRPAPLIQYAPEFQLQMRSHAVPINMTTKFTCSVRSRPDARISWSINDIPIEHGVKYTTSCLAGVATLTINKCNGSDAGTYRCTAKNSVGETSDYAQLEVIGASDGYKASSNTLKNSSFTMRDYELDYWTREQKREDDLASLRSGSSLASMKAEAGKPYFVRKPASQEVTEGDDVCVTCSVDAQPSARVKWTKDGESVKESVRILVSSHGNQHRMEISGARFEDAGLYKVIAENANGRASATFRVDINVKNRRGSNAISLSGSNSSEKNGPRIISDLKAKMQLGGVLKLETSVLNDAAVSDAVWYKDNRKIRDSDPKMQSGSRMGNYYLEIFNLDKYDDGCYACHLVGSRGGQSTTQLVISSADVNAYLNNSIKAQAKKAGSEAALSNKSSKYQSKTSLEPSTLAGSQMNLSVEPLPSDVSVSIGKTLPLTTSWNGPGASVSWYINGMEISETDRIKIDNTSYSSTLSIRNATPDDAGLYRITVQNAGGTDTSEVIATIM